MVAGDGRLRVAGRPFAAGLLLPALLVAAAGCHPSPTLGELPLPVVAAARPLQRDVAPHLAFTGRRDAVNRVAVRSRVSGYLDEIAFDDGQVVKAGQVLFVIDPRPYQAAMEAAEAEVSPPAGIPLHW